MWPQPHAERDPNHAALICSPSGEVVTYQELDQRSNQLANLFYDRGIRFGDHVAIYMTNNAHYLSVAWAAQRSGIYFTPINFHFNAEEVAYILDDCDAQALIVSSDLEKTIADIELPEKVSIRLMVTNKAKSPKESSSQFEDFDSESLAYPTTPLAEELEGHAMMYSSGTTGRPKGIRYQLERKPVGNPTGGLAGFQTTYNINEETIYLSPAPLYHSAPLQFSIAVTRCGGTVVMSERFDAEECLASIERFKITHAQFVPTMFVRMLKLPASVRDRYDVSSLQMVIHAAAPCPVEIKRRMIEWWGPIITEYYAATEGMGSTMITSEEWLAHPGSVGRPFFSNLHILDEDNNEVPQGEAGVVYFEPGERTMDFAYHKDPEKTAGGRNQQGWSTVGDIGYLDADGYLYLTDRRDFMIVSGGVNIYPQEAENLLITHDLVMDAAVFGIPDTEMGERVHAVVQPIDMALAGPDLEQTLIEFCRENLAHYKCPVAIDFDAELPRQPTGKLYKRLLRDRYWGNSESRIV